MLRTKLHIPEAARKNLVARPKLLESLHEGLHFKLTAITAPAGFGKTTLLTAWTKQSDSKIGWVSLDQHDNDMVRFWSYVVAAVRGEQPKFHGCIELASVGQQAYTRFLDAFIHELSSYPGEFALILDDYHVIERSDIHESMVYLLEYLPANIHLYIVSRTELPFPVSRLLAKGEMQTITMKDMRFELREGLCFFRECMGIELSYEDTAMIVNRTEGWVSGLHLAAISLKKSSEPSAFIHKFSGRQREIAQYLMEEVLGRQTDEIKSCLLQTSILAKMNASLCEAVIGRGGGQILLESLESQQLFISPLDEHGEWYRYHQLFSDFLQKQFRSLHSEQWEKTHAQAARWLEANGEPEVAVEHWLTCGRYEDAATLIENHFSALQDHRASLLRWLRTMPEAALRTKPFLQLLYLKMISELGNFHLANQKLRNLESELDRPEWKAWLGAYYFLAAETALYCQDLPGSFRYLELYDQYEPQGTGNPLQMIAGNTLAGINFTSLLSFFHHMEEAETFLLTCIRIWEGKGESPFLGYLYYFYSELLIEWDRLEEAEILLRRMLYPSQWQPYARIWYYATVTLARLRLIKGESENAFSMMEKVNDRLEHTPDRELFVKSLHAEAAYLSIFAGKIEQVTAWLHSSGLKHTDIVPYSYRDYYILARALIEIGQTSEAIGLLERLHQMTEQNNWMWDRFKVLILLSMALDKHGKEKEAITKLETVLHLAEAQGFVRSIINEGKAMGSMLARYVSCRLSGSYSPLHPVSVSYVKKLLSKMNIRLEGELDLPHLLTSRETSILQLVEKGYKNREIAEQLGVSDETVKTHLKHIYQKLEATSRVQAVIRAKDLHLL